MDLVVVWSPRARLDLKSVVQYIAQDRPETAKRFGHRIFEAVEGLLPFVERGRVVPEFVDPSIREIMVPPYRIIYRVKLQQNRIEIVRVWHAARGIPEISDPR